MYLSQIPQSVKDVVIKRIQELESVKQGNQGVDMRPMPTQRPPRRESVK